MSVTDSRLPVRSRMISVFTPFAFFCDPGIS